MAPSPTCLLPLPDIRRALPRNRFDFVHLDKQARITNWDTNFVDEKNPAIITNELNAELSTKLHVQDISEGDDDVRDTKPDHSRNLIDFSQTQKTPNEVMEAKGDAPLNPGAPLF